MHHLSNNSNVELYKIVK